MKRDRNKRRVVSFLSIYEPNVNYSIDNVSTVFFFFLYNIFIKSRKDIFYVANKVLIDTDYACLIAIGAPKDEYESKTLMIADYIIENEMNICTSEMVCDVFKEMFEEDLTIKEFDYISTEINKKT